MTRTSLALILAATLAAAPRPLERATAEDVLEQMAKTYATARSYRDTGYVESALASGTTVKPFSTAFVRPSQFRFEYRQTRFGVTSQNILWQKGDSLQHWLSMYQNHLGKPESLNLGIAGMTGVSSGSGYRVPSLLLPDVVTGRRVIDMPSVARMTDTTIDGRACYRIRGVAVTAIEPIPANLLPAGFPQRAPNDTLIDSTTFFIDREQLVLRRVESQTRTKTTGATRTVTVYDPHVNGLIPDSLLAFRPPKG